MNVSLSNRHTVHTANGRGRPACNARSSRVLNTFDPTQRPVDCKKCLKILADNAEREAAYQARLAASLAPATESMDLGYVAPAGAADEQPEEVRTVREAAEDAADDARLESSMLRLSARMGSMTYRKKVRCTECGQAAEAVSNQWGRDFMVPRHCVGNIGGTLNIMCPGGPAGKTYVEAPGMLGQSQYASYIETPEMREAHAEAIRMDRDAQCPECGRSYSHKLDCTTGRRQR